MQKKNKADFFLDGLTRIEAHSIAKAAMFKLQSRK